MAVDCLGSRRALCRMAALGGKPAFGGQVVMPSLTPQQQAKVQGRTSIAEK